ncbi:hypothetical protein D2H34_003939 [Vibrio fluvialis]
MAVKVNQVELLKDYFFGVVERSEHHAPNVNEVIYPLLGLIVLKMDDNSDIQVRGSQGVTGNILWFTTNSQRYAFRYEHEDDTIEIRKDSFKGDVVAKVNNSTTVADLKNIFASL